MIEQLIEKYSKLLKEMSAMHKHTRNFGFESLVKEFLDDLEKIDTAIKNKME